MMRALDYFLDRITMYRLVLYILIALVGIASILGFFQLVPFVPEVIIFSALFLIGVGWIANKFFSWIFHAPTNVESVYITALILSLIVTPAESLKDFPILAVIVVLAMASKYILVIGKRHIFNPTAIAVVLSAILLKEGASWWVGTAWMAPFVALSGLLIFRKLRFGALAWSFFVSSSLVILGFSFMQGTDPLIILEQNILQSALLFFGSIMVTEPSTVPPTKKLQVMYAGLVGILSVPQMQLGSFTITPELALCIGNIFSYVVSPSGRLVATLSKKATVAKDVTEFVFTTPSRFSYLPGQYMEWTLPHAHTDSRGNRRYFTLASSPTEDKIRLGIKFYQSGSSFKNALSHLDKSTPIVGARALGEFILPKDPQQKLVFLAGGIGITPFRSIVKYLLDTKQTRDIVLFYANKADEEIAYQDIFSAAQKQFGLKVFYTLTNRHAIPHGWRGSVGRIDAEIIRQKIPDFAERLFYLSGPRDMVNAYEEVLKQLGIHQSHIKKDYFPGYV